MLLIAERQFLPDKIIELPCNDDALQGQPSKLDFEDGLLADVSKYSIGEINELVEEFELLSEDDQNKVKALIEACNFDLKTALECRDDVEFYPGMELKEVAAELVDEGYFGEISEIIINYIDYDAIARDLRIDGYCETEYGVIRMD